jgi:hypothetical protein
MPSTSASVAGQRVLGKSIAILAMTAMLVYGCERSKEQPPTKPATPAPAKTPESSGKPAATDKPAADAPKDPAPKGADADKPVDPNAKPKLPPIPHTELAKDAKPASEFVAPPGGVTVQDFKTGEGFPVLPKAKVTVHFVMYLKDGWKKIESTYDRGEPLTALVNEFVLGMGDGLIGMKQGGMRRLIVPAARAYGDEGRPGIDGGPDIPPGATLVFDVDLVSIQQKLINPEPKPAAPSPKVDDKPDMNK